MTCENSGKAKRLKHWQISAIVAFILAAGACAGIPLGVMIVREDAEKAIAELRSTYAEASEARLQTLNVCLANQGKAAITASEAAKVAGDAAKAAAKAVDAAAGKKETEQRP
jgi:hypothetical protein